MTEQVLGAAIDVHDALGPGLLESAYEQCLCHELSLRGVRFERQVPLPLVYKGTRLDCGYRLDLVVEDTVVVELKAVADVPTIAEAQLLSYLKLSGKSVGLIINFHVSSLAEGITRRVL